MRTEEVEEEEMLERDGYSSEFADRGRFSKTKRRC